MNERTPLRQLMPGALDDASIDRIWTGVKPRRAAIARARARTWAAFAVSIVLLVLGFGWTRLPGDAGPLRAADGSALTVLTAATASRAFSLSDGSRIELAQGTTFTARASTGVAFEGALRDGSATFDVVPGGPRRWSIDCGLATVEVIGTRFAIEARDDRVMVRVERGRVRVQSAQGTRELGAGDALEVRSEATPAASAPTPAASMPIVRPNDLPSAREPVPAKAEAPWRDLARAQDYRGAYDALGASGVVGATSHASIDDLFTLADVARLSGHPSDAVAPLERIVAEHPQDARAGLAAFTLGRLELDTLGRPARAAKAFSRAIELGLTGALLEDAHTRLVEARAKAGDVSGARAAYDAYVRAFPSGSRTTTMRRWLDDDAPR